MPVLLVIEGVNSLVIFDAYVFAAVAACVCAATVLFVSFWEL